MYSSEDIIKDLYYFWNTLTCWIHFKNVLSASSVWQKLQTHLHTRYILRMHLLDSKFQNTYSLNIFWRDSIKYCSLLESVSIHLHSGHIFFLKISKHSLAENIYCLNMRGHCKLVQFNRKCQHTLTSWTHFEAAINQSSITEMSEYTYKLDTFWGIIASQSSLTEHM